MIKAVIPVAGMGSNLRPHTHTQPKALVPVAGKPILGHIFEALSQAGIEHFVLVIGYLGDKIEAYVAQHHPQLKVDYVIQEPRMGLGHAILLTQPFFREAQEMLIYLGDTIVYADLQAFLQAPDSVLGVKKVENPRKFGVAELDSEGLIKRLVEKPAIPKSNLALVGVYKISQTDRLFNALQDISQHRNPQQDEIQLTDGLMKMISDGQKMTTFQVSHWYDCGKKETLLEANAILLNRLGFRDMSYPDYPDTILIPPVSIGKNCQLKSAIIGPNVAIGDNTTIRSSIVQDSIIGSFSELEYAVLSQSIIGNDTILKGMVQSLNIGDNTEINLGR